MKFILNVLKNLPKNKIDILKKNYIDDINDVKNRNGVSSINNTKFKTVLETLIKNDFNINDKCPIHHPFTNLHKLWLDILVYEV